MKERCIVIPAVKKNVAFCDDLVKKLDGVMLIQRIIDKAKKIEQEENIVILTDSEEISVICERNNIPYSYDREMKLDESEGMPGLLPGFFVNQMTGFENVIVLWPYAPLVKAEDIECAYELFKNKNSDGLISVKGSRHEFELDKDSFLKKIKKENKEFFVEIKAFMIFQAQAAIEKNIRWRPYVLESGRLEIKDYHDWWVCERLLMRRRIVFRVIGDSEVGMGHVYRALALAHENTKDEIIFVCDKEGTFAVNKIAGHDYPIEVLDRSDIEKRIIELKPDLVINDILNTGSDYIRALKRSGAKVVNFEDLGPGSKIADLVFNEVFDVPSLNGDNFRWGHEYYFLRDEFIGAKRKLKWCKNVSDVLITFGGTDQTNLTLAALETIYGFCKDSKINIHIVTGPGYLHIDSLKSFVTDKNYKGVFFTNQTGVMSRIMEKTSIAICSNGRTVYELAHMHIPSLTIAHHDRERTHNFSCKKNGFIPLGVYSRGKTEKALLRNFKKLCLEHAFRKKLWERTLEFNFIPNKKRVVSEIERHLYGE